MGSLTNAPLQSKVVKIQFSDGVFYTRHPKTLHTVDHILLYGLPCLLHLVKIYLLI